MGIKGKTAAIAAAAAALVGLAATPGATQEVYAAPGGSYAYSQGGPVTSTQGYPVDPGVGTYSGEPGLSRSSAYSLSYPPRGVTYPPIDAYGASGDPGPNYVLPPREVSVSVRPLIYNGYESTEYPQNVSRPYASQTTYVREHVRVSTRRRVSYHSYHRHAWHHAHVARRVTIHETAYAAGDRDDLPAPTRYVKRCISNDWGRQDCRTSIY